MHWLKKLINPGTLTEQTKIEIQQVEADKDEMASSYVSSTSQCGELRESEYSSKVDPKRSFQASKSSL